MLNRTWIPLSIVLALALSTGGQTAANPQTSASSTTQASASAGKAGVQSQADSSASASKQSSSSQQGQKGQGKQSTSSTAASASHSASASASAGNNSLNLASGTTINATLLTPLDAHRSKPGDRVVARVDQDVKQEGTVVVRKGTKLMGHVTQAQARSKENSQSSLGVLFDSAAMKNGQQQPLHLSIQALAAAQTASSAALGENDATMMGSGAARGSAGASGGLLRGVGSAAGGAVGAAGNVAGNAGQTVGGTVNATSQTAASAAGSASGLNAAGQLTSASSGAIGLKGLSLSSAASSATQGSVVTSSSRNVHLDSGTQLLLRAASE